MGTALVLLFLLALGAIPGALVPQRSLNAGKVDDYLKAHPLIGPWLNKLQAFDVFSSFWFTAIYVLLFVSLVGCLTPRMIEHARSLRATPVAAPRNLARLPKHAGSRVAGSPSCWPPPSSAGYGAGAPPSAAPAPPSRCPPKRVTCANSATWSSTSPCWVCWSPSPSASCSATRAT
ncbi:resB-like family protein [Mycobacterium ulcerans str. Harvey]|uniref:ResB-like family protein n=1 Tax=Mycobacterium ulcerans str. Harvey TaxID=1299332 RepID=A0ABN0R5R5_MYCUL|nr:resB-like family protein [Mycobacterium ulcerans str. Harvey]